ncbi:MAG: HNH endonuclease [Chloroflexota bacterium]
MEALVLVLNSNFEPLNVCNIRRAVILMLSGKAGLIANGRGIIKTVSTNFPIPSIIRLSSQVNRPRPRVKLTRREVFHRDNYTCQYCGRKLSSLTIDHIIPRHLGGKHTWSNVITACASCNHQKGGRNLEETRLSLLSTPKEPAANMNYIFGEHIRVYSDWEPYIRGW